MNPYRCRIVLRPRDPLEVFDLTWRFLREGGRPLLTMATAVLLPTWLLLALIAWASDGHWATLLATLCIGPLLRAPFTLLGGRLLFDDEVRVRDVLRDLLGRAPALAMTGVFVALGWVAAASTCFVALPWTRGAQLWLPETALLERVSAARGQRRAARLAAGQIGAAAVGVLAGAALPVWAALAAEATGHAVVRFVFQLGEPFGSLVTLQVTPYLLAGVLASQPLYAIYRLLLYVDARTRQEGWDLQVGLRAAGLA